MDRIEGSVARILNARELVVNRGSEHGLSIGMQLAVLNKKGGAIKDPETGEDLGSIEVPKVVLKVVQLYEKMAVASTFRQYKTRPGALAGVSFFESLYSPSETVVETLKTSGSTYKEELDSGDSYVHEGDRVVEIVGDEFAGWVSRG